jgi:hypothetical protein
MNLRTKIAIATAAAGFVAGTAYSIAADRRTKKMIKEEIETAVEAFESSELIAFNRAQDEVSDRMLAGYYDDKTDDDYRLDFQLLYTNYLLGN